MENGKEHFRNILLLYFMKGKSAAYAHKKICAVYGDDENLKLRQCQNWFMKFRAGDFNVKDSPRSGRPKKVNIAELKELIESNHKLTTRKIAAALNISKFSVEKHLKELGYVYRRDSWICCCNKITSEKQQQQIPQYEKQSSSSSSSLEGEGGEEDKDFDKNKNQV